jgi:hypothetical protein
MAIAAITYRREIAASLHKIGVEGLRRGRLDRRYRWSIYNCKGRDHTPDQEPRDDACDNSWFCHPSQLLLLWDTASTKACREGGAGGELNWRKAD